MIDGKSDDTNAGREPALETFWASGESRAPRTPDIMAPLIGFRDWRLTDDGLCSPRASVLWKTAVLQAECLPRSPEDLVREPHVAPEDACGCGIHAYHSPRWEVAQIDWRAVPGIVSMWGRVVVTSGSLRAEHARVEALCVYRRWTRRQKSAVASAAIQLGVDLIDVSQCAATPYGTSLSASVLETAPRRLLVAGHAERIPASD